MMTSVINRHFSVFPMVCLLLLVACGERPTVQLFEIEDVSPEVIEPGDVLRVRGLGFVEGPAQIVLDGQFRPEGMGAARAARFHLNGIAISNQLIEVPVHSRTMARITSESTRFDGELVISFPGTFDGGTVSLEARSKPLTLQFHPAGGGVRHQAQRTQAGRLFLEQWGIRMQTDMGTDTLIVREVQRGSRAQDSGIAPGFRLISVNEIPVRGLADLATLMPDESYQFQFVTVAGKSVSLIIGVGHFGVFGRDELMAVLISSIVLGFLFALAYVPPPSGNHHPWKSSTQFLTNTTGGMLATGITLMASAAIVTFRLNIGGTILLAFLYAAWSVFLLFWQATPVAGRLLRSLTGILSTGILMITGAAAASSPGILDIALSPTPSAPIPVMWQNPVLTTAGLVYIATLGTPVIGRNSDGWAGPLTGWIHRTISALIVVFFFLGGFSVPFAHYGYPWEIADILRSVLVLFLKTGVVLYLSRALSGNDQPDRRQDDGKVGLSMLYPPLLAGLCGVGLWLEWAASASEWLPASRMLAVGVFFSVLSFALCSRIFNRSREMPANQP